MCTCDTARRIGSDLHPSSHCPDRCGQQHIATASKESYKQRGPDTNIFRLGLLLCLQSSHSHLPESGVHVEVHALTDCCAKQSRLQTPVEPCPAMFTDDLDKAARCCFALYSPRGDLCESNWLGAHTSAMSADRPERFFAATVRFCCSMSCDTRPVLPRVACMVDSCRQNLHFLCLSTAGKVSWVGSTKSNATDSCLCIWST